MISNRSIKLSIDLIVCEYVYTYISINQFVNMEFFIRHPNIRCVSVLCVNRFIMCMNIQSRIAKMHWCRVYLVHISISIRRLENLRAAYGNGNIIILSPIDFVQNAKRLHRMLSSINGIVAHTCNCLLIDLL